MDEFFLIKNYDPVSSGVVEEKPMIGFDSTLGIIVLVLIAVLLAVGLWVYKITPTLG